MIDIYWKPRPSDIDWTANLIRGLKHGGTWVIPMNGSIWQLDKEKKTFICTVGALDDMFWKVYVCCKALGYRALHADSTMQASIISAETAGTGKYTENHYAQKYQNN